MARICGQHAPGMQEALVWAKVSLATLELVHHELTGMMDSRTDSPTDCRKIDHEKIQWRKIQSRRDWTSQGTERTKERTERRKTFLCWVLFYDGTFLVFLRWVLFYMLGISTLGHILHWVILSRALYDVRWILFYGGLHLWWVFIYDQIFRVRSLYVQSVYGEAKVLDKRLQFNRIYG